MKVRGLKDRETGDRSGDGGRSGTGADTGRGAGGRDDFGPPRGSNRPAQRPDDGDRVEGRHCRRHGDGGGATREMDVNRGRPARIPRGNAARLKAEDVGRVEGAQGDGAPEETLQDERVERGHGDDRAPDRTVWSRRAHAPSYRPGRRRVNTAKPGRANSRAVWRRDHDRVIGAIDPDHVDDHGGLRPSQGGRHGDRSRHEDEEPGPSGRVRPRNHAGPRPISDGCRRPGGDPPGPVQPRQRTGFPVARHGPAHRESFWRVDGDADADADQFRYRPGPQSGGRDFGRAVCGKGHSNFRSNSMDLLPQPRLISR